MSPILKTGALIGVLCALWMLVMGYTGWYKHPALNYLFFVVVVTEVVLLLRGLRETAPESTYGEQVVNGTLMAVVAAIIIFPASLLFTNVLFPNYFTEIEQMGRQVLAGQGLPADEVEAQLKAMRPFQTPLVNATTGAVATVITGLFASLLIAVRQRKR